jgi:TonB family protein
MNEHITNFARPNGQIMFSYDMKTENSAGAFVGSFIVQALIVLALLFVSVSAPKIFESANSEHVTLEFNEPQPAVVPTKPLVAPSAPQPPVPVRAEPKLGTPVIPLQKVPEVKPQILVKLPTEVKPVPTFDYAPVKQQEAHARVETNVFSGPSAAEQKRAGGVVQIAGFGNPAGAKSSSSGRASVTPIAGFSDGNRGYVGTQGAHGVVQRVGFGNGAGHPDASGHGGQVQSTQFGAAAAPVAEKRPVIVEAKLVPVRIISKSSPIYSDEARKLHLEGEVFVSVVFCANGSVRFIGIVKGLGHGLDEAAVAAARGIRFSPAQQNNQQVDYPVVLHIVFSLS